MTLRFSSTTGPQHGNDTAGKLARLAQRLQNDPHERLSEEEMEAMAREVGLDPSFMQSALERVSAVPGAVVRPAPAPVAPAAQPVAAFVPPSKQWWRRAEVLSPVWWATGWMLFPLLGVVETTFFIERYGGPPFTSMMFALGLYIGVGMILSRLKKEEEEERRYLAHTGVPLPAAGAGTPVSRERLIETLFSLQRQLEGDRRRRAFLSLDIADACALQRSGTELEVEYSFTQLGRWIEETVQEHGGTVQSSAGDGMMCAFPEDAAAVRCARRLQEGLARFNAERSRLRVPFRLRCGVSAGEVAAADGVALGSLHSSVIDRAARLQKQAEPGSILVSGSVQSAALAELGTPVLSPLTADGEPVFTWGVSGIR
ncbi:MAG: adenylate/guanylate cyclase domain-containing protein [Armatimonadota bacterium]